MAPSSRVEEAGQRLDAAHDHDQIVLVAEPEDGIDQIVAGALLAELHLEAVGEEGEQVGQHLLAHEELAGLAVLGRGGADRRGDGFRVRGEHLQPGAGGCRARGPDG